jgi:hypothetical protein
MFLNVLLEHNNSLQMWRAAFFVSLAFTAVGPLAILAYLHGTEQMLNFFSEHTRFN